MLVYNSAHIKNQGCSPEDLFRSLFAVGYRVWYSGIFIYRELELTKFIRGMTGRSTELLFVLPDAPLF